MKIIQDRVRDFGVRLSRSFVSVLSRFFSDGRDPFLDPFPVESSVFVKLVRLIFSPPPWGGKGVVCDTGSLTLVVRRKVVLRRYYSTVRKGEKRYNVDVSYTHLSRKRWDLIGLPQD